jgi:ferredoxin-type protein NapH
MKKRQKIRSSLILFSFFLFPATFYYLSPVLIIQSSFQGIINGSWIVFVLLFISSMYFGRAWCGWLCPAAGCQEAMFTVRDKRINLGDWIKWLIWFPWIISILIFAIRAGGYRRVDFFYQTVYGVSISDLQSLIAFLFVLLGLIVLPAYLIGRRSFCHHLCWMAPFLICGRAVRNIWKWPSLRLSVGSERCIHCHTCTTNCPMSLPVENMVENGKMENVECILCGSCADNCTEEVICLGFSKSRS